MCRMGLYFIELVSQMAGACIGLQQVIVGESAAEMDSEEDIAGKSVLKCTGCKLQVYLE